MLAVKPGQRREFVQNPTPFSPVPFAYRPAIAATNSSGAAMLIRFIISPADENPAAGTASAANQEITPCTLAAAPFQRQQTHPDAEWKRRPGSA
jgi:hypothetical protein